MSLIDDELEEHYPTPARPGTVIMLTLGQYIDDLRSAYRQGAQRELNPMCEPFHRASDIDPRDRDEDGTIWGRVITDRATLAGMIDDALAALGLVPTPSDDPADTGHVLALARHVWDHADPTDVTDLIETTKETHA